MAKIWDLLERRHLFKARDYDRRLDDGVHLGEMHALLGSPPREFLARSEKCLQYWDEDDRYGLSPRYHVLLTDDSKSLY